MNTRHPEDQLFQDLLMSICGSLNHEINNPLTCILGNTELLLMNPVCDNPDVRRKLKVIEETAMRIQDAVVRLANLSEPVYARGPAGVRLLDLRRPCDPAVREVGTSGGHPMSDHHDSSRKE